MELHAGKIRHHIVECYRKFAHTLHGSPALVEVLEPRTLMSIAPTIPAAQTQADFENNSPVTAIANSANGSKVTAWTYKSGGVNYLGISVSNAKGEVYTLDALSAKNINTGFAATQISATIDDSGRGAVAFIANGQAYISKFMVGSTSKLYIYSGFLLPQTTTYSSLKVDSCDIAMASGGNGDFVFAWSGTVSRNIPVSNNGTVSADVSVVLCERYSWGYTNWAATEANVVYDNGTGPSMNLYDHITSLDLTMNASGSYAVGFVDAIWNVNDDSAETFLLASKRYSSQDIVMNGSVNNGFTLIKAIDSSSISGTPEIQVALNNNGVLYVLGYEAQYGNSASGSAVATGLGYTDLYACLYDVNGRQIGKTLTIDSKSSIYTIVDYSASVDHSGNMLVSWRPYHSSASGTDDVIYLQTVSAKGALVGKRDTVDVPVSGSTYLNMSKILVNDHGFDLAYMALDYDSGTSMYDCKVNTIYFNRALSDLQVTIASSTLKPTYSVVDFAKGDVVLNIANVGSAAAIGKIEIFASVSSDTVFGDGIDLPVSFGSSSSYMASLNLKPGASTRITLKNVAFDVSQVISGTPYLLFDIMPVQGTQTIQDENISNNVTAAQFHIDNNINDLAVTSASAKFANDILIPGDTGTVTFTLRNMGSSNFKNEMITYQIIATPTAGAGKTPIIVASVNMPLSLNVGASKTISQAIKISNKLDQRQYSFSISAVFAGALVDADSLNNSMNIADYVVTHEFGKIAGRSGSTKLIWDNGDGTTSTYSMTGQGFGRVVAWDESGTIPSVMLYDTDGTTAVTVTSTSKQTGLDSQPKMGDIVAFGDLKSFTAANFRLMGDANFYAIGGLTLGNVYSTGVARKISIGNEDTSLSSNTKLSTVITLGNVLNLNLLSTEVISSMTVKSWDDKVTAKDAFSILAPRMSSLKVTGDTAASLNGIRANVGLYGNSYYSQTNLGTEEYQTAALKNVDVKGLIGGRWVVDGSVGTIKASTQANTFALWSSGSIGSVSAQYGYHVSILAGINATNVDDYINDSVDPDVHYTPRTSGDFINSMGYTFRNATIGSVTFGTKIASSTLNIAASSVGNINLGMLDLYLAPGSQFATLSAATPKSKYIGSLTFKYQDADDGNKVKTYTWKQGASTQFPTGSILLLLTIGRP